jgi:hypothetical protein
MKKLIVAIVLAVLFLLALPLIVPPTRPVAGSDDLPWQIELQADGSTRVFGLAPGRSKLAEVRSRFANDLDLAIIAAPGEAGELEAYSASLPAGMIGGKMVFSAEIAPEVLAQMRQRSPKSSYMESTTRRYNLHPDDVSLAWGAPLRAITYIPSTNLDETLVLQRFGKPAERVRVSEQLEHFLYPERGLDLLLDKEGPEVLQYVEPKRFAALREPLLKKAQPTAQ